MVRWATTWHLARRSTVTGTCSPASVKTRVMPTFCAITPERMLIFPISSGSELDLDVDTRGKIELHQRVHRLRRRIDDIEQPLVCAHLELLAALLVDVRRTIDGEFLDPGRQRDRTAHLRTGALGSRHDLARRRIENTMIECLEPDADILAVHVCSDDTRQRRDDDRGRISCPLTFITLALAPSSVCPLPILLSRPPRLRRRFCRPRGWRSAASPPWRWA